MEIILSVFSGYMVLGLIALAILDLTTKRIRSRLKSASLDTLILTGENHKVAILVTVLALWLLWPAAIYAAVRG